MSNSSIRLLKAREALRIDESLVGLQTRVEAEQIRARTLAPVLLGPAERPTLIRLLIDTCPPGGWIGLCGVSDIGWNGLHSRGWIWAACWSSTPGRRHMPASCAPC